jgi:hypothetical protein
MRITLDFEPTVENVMTPSEREYSTFGPVFHAAMLNLWKFDFKSQLRIIQTWMQQDIVPLALLKSTILLHLEYVCWWKSRVRRSWIVSAGRPNVFETIDFFLSTRTLRPQTIIIHAKELNRLIPTKNIVKKIAQKDYMATKLCSNPSWICCLHWFWAWSLKYENSELLWIRGESPQGQKLEKNF